MGAKAVGSRAGSAMLAVALTVPLLLGAPPVEAQSPRDSMIRDWERSRDAVLAFAQAMPEEHLDFRPTPGVRSYAEQIEHIVQDNARIVAMAFGRDDLPDFGDRDEYLTRTEALVRHVETGYDYVMRAVREVSDEELAAEAVLFGRAHMPAWRALEAAREHATWTLGQTIPYLRLNGVQPPAYPIFHPSEVRSPP